MQIILSSEDANQTFKKKKKRKIIAASVTINMYNWAYLFIY